VHLLTAAAVEQLIEHAVVQHDANVAAPKRDIETAAYVAVKHSRMQLLIISAVARAAKKTRVGSDPAL
jgi:hypothetical protein